MPECSVCGMIKPLARFFKNHRQCKLCWQAKNKEWRSENQIKYQRACADRQLRNRYGITLETYERLLAEQNNCCAICKSKDSGHRTRSGKPGRFHVDHRHGRGRSLRMLLCFNCNIALGKVKEDIMILREMIHYIEVWNDDSYYD